MLEKLSVIAKFTFKEIIKSKILVNTVILGFVLLLITFVAYNFTYGEPERIALDFGLGTLSLSSVGIAIFFGVGLLSKEIENRTVYMIISRPVSRTSFLLGKVLGLINVLLLNILILSLLTLVLYFLIGGHFSPLILWSICFIALESIIVLLVVCALTLVTSQTLAIIGTIMLYISGHAIPAAQSASFGKSIPILTKALDFYHFILPGFYKLNIKNFVLYQQNLSFQYLGLTLVYSLLYCSFLIYLSVYLFNKKNLD